MTTTLEGHLDSELLSAFLDGEPADLDRPKIEGHLDACPSCRHRLEGLQRVAETLQRLERAAPPPLLDVMVRRQIVIERERGSSGLRWRSQRWSGAVSGQVAIMFAVVFALAVILYLFTSGLERRSRQQPILVPVFEREVEPGIDSAEPGSKLAPTQPEQVSVGSRTFVRTPGGYRQLGANGAAIRALEVGSAEAERLFDGEPGLRTLVSRGEVILILDGDLVVLVADDEK